jgi:hypothetical protein
MFHADRGRGGGLMGFMKKRFYSGSPCRRDDGASDDQPWNLFSRVWLAMIAGKVFGRKKKKVA